MIEDNISKDMDGVFPGGAGGDDIIIDGGSFEFYSTAPYETWSGEEGEADELWF